MQNETDIKAKNSMARISLIIGVLGLPTAGIFCIGGLIGLVLGERGFNNAKKFPEKYGGKRIAIAGIITNFLALVLGVIAVLMPGMYGARKSANQSTAQGYLRSIAAAEITYFETHKRYGSLHELFRENLIDGGFSEPIKLQYRFSIETTEEPPTFCVHADRVESSSGYRDLNISEDGIIRYIESNNKGSVARGAGTPVK